MCLRLTRVCHTHRYSRNTLTSSARVTKSPVRSARPRPTPGAQQPWEVTALPTRPLRQAPAPGLGRWAATRASSRQGCSAPLQNLLLHTTPWGAPDTVEPSGQVQPMSGACWVAAAPSHSLNHSCSRLQEATAAFHAGSALPSLEVKLHGQVRSLTAVETGAIWRSLLALRHKGCIIFYAISIVVKIINFAGWVENILCFLARGKLIFKGEMPSDFEKKCERKCCACK